MLFIILLTLFGLLFLIAEVILIPGTSIATLIGMVCYGSAIYISFRDYGTVAGIVVILVILLLSALAVYLSLRAKTWQRFQLKQKIDSTGFATPQQHQVRNGDRGHTVSRLSPMGTVEIGGRIYEAKSIDRYVDPRQEVEVVGFENSHLIVRIPNESETTK